MQARTRTRTYTNPHGTEARAAGRSGRVCVARAVSVERGSMGEHGFERGACACLSASLFWVLCFFLGAPQDNEAKFEVAEAHFVRAESLGMHFTSKKQREIASL